MTLLLLGGMIYVIIPILKFKLISAFMMVAGYFMVKYSDKIIITLGGMNGKTKLRKPQ